MKSPDSQTVAAQAADQIAADQTVNVNPSAAGKPLYGILVVYIPFSILFLLANLLGTVYRLLAPDLSISSIFSFDVRLLCLAGFLSAVGASCYAGIIKKSSMNHDAANIRGGIVAAMAAYLIISLLRFDTLFFERFLPSVNSITSVLAAVFMWIVPIKLKTIFKVFEQLESLTEEYHGDQLRSVIREFAPEMGEANRNLKKLMVQYSVVLLLCCLTLTSIGFLRSSILSIIFVILIFFAGFILLAFLGLARRELACASEGFSVTARDRSILFPVVALGIVITIILAATASADTSLIPPQVIPMFFVWLFRLLFSWMRPRERVPVEPEFFEFESMNMQGEGLSDFFSDVEPSGPWPGWRWVKYGLIALAAFLFVLFMIYPLLKRSGSSVKAKKIADAVSRWLTALKNGIITFFTAVGGWQAFGKWRFSKKKKKLDKEKLRDIASQLLGSAKQKELVKSVNLFARLILWGSETLKVSWRPSLPPGEFCGLLASRLINTENSIEIGDAQKIKEGVIRCGELFEKALYSPRRLSAQEEQYFKQTIEGITG